MPALQDEIWQYRLPMLRLAASILHHPQNAEDAVSRAMLLALQHGDTLRSDASLKPWLMRITARCAYDLVRREKRERLHAPSSESTCTLFVSAQETCLPSSISCPKASRRYWCCITMKASTHRKSPARWAYRPPPCACACLAAGSASGPFWRRKKHERI